jgi:NADH:ubiquinone oxidoreductase subunit 6 (subunit J)
MSWRAPGNSARRARFSRAAHSLACVLTSEVGTLATYGFMLAYALVSVAAPVFLAKRRTLKPLTLVLGVLGAVIMLFVFYVNWIPQLIPNDIFAALSWPLWALPYIFLAWTAVGIAWYQVIRRTRPDVINSAGRWGELASLPEPARTPGAT